MSTLKMSTHKMSTSQNVECQLLKFYIVTKCTAYLSYFITCIQCWNTTCQNAPQTENFDQYQLYFCMWGMEWCYARSGGNGCPWWFHDLLWLSGSDYCVWNTQDGRWTWHSECLNSWKLRHKIKYGSQATSFLIRMIYTPSNYSSSCIEEKVAQQRYWLVTPTPLAVHVHFNI